MVKMYELDTTQAQAEAATAAAAEFRDYVVSLIEERRREPRDDLVTRLAETPSGTASSRCCATVSSGSGWSGARSSRRPRSRS